MGADDGTGARQVQTGSREACETCPITTDGVCRSHDTMIVTSRWVVGLVVSLLLAILAAIGGTWSSVGQLGRAVAVAAQRGETNARAIQDVRRDVRDLRERVWPR